MKNISKSILFYISVIFILSLICGCSKEQLANTSIQSPANLADLLYLKKISNERDGSIGISTLSGFGPNDKVHAITAGNINAAFFDDKGIRLPYGELSINDIELSPNHQFNYFSSHNEDNEKIKSLFGGKVSVQLEKEENFERNTEVIFSSTIDLPEQIYVHAPLRRNKTIFTNDGIRWNPPTEETEENKVFIIIDFHPKDVGNDAFEQTHRHFAKIIETKDNGSYTLSPEDFGTTPIGGHISLVIGRGNYKVEESQEGKTIVIYGYTAAFSRLRLKD